jgi:hypothetical protein
MDVVEEHHSPDGFLRLLVTRDDGGDVAIGFDGYTWHTHGDILAALSGLPEEDAIRLYVDSILGDEQIIGVLRMGGKVQDVWVIDNLGGIFQDLLLEESQEFRRWSGQTVPVEAGEFPERLP